MTYHQLTENERYQIYALNKAEHSQKEIAEFLIKAQTQSAVNCAEIED